MKQSYSVLLALYVCLLAGLTALNALGPERWWFSGFNLYLPQFVWGVPGVVLLAWSVKVGWRAVVASVACLAWVAWPIMGFNAPVAAGRANAAGTPIRVLTYNVKWGYRDPSAEAADIDRYQPDIVQCQDSSGALGSQLGVALAGYKVEVSGQYIVASKLPITPLRNYDVSYAGSQHHVTRAAVKIGRTWVALYDVHLLSPRAGLGAVRHRDIAPMQANADERCDEAVRLAAYIHQEKGPVLLTGDLNAPMQSLVCRALADAGLRDAFQDCAWGYGYTYGRFTKARFPYVRIDHIMYNDRLAALHCWVGNDRGSDHCPVIADLAIVGAR